MWASIPMKYSKDLCNIPSCPPANCLNINIEAYRFVFNPICNASFIPQGKTKPQRIVNATSDTLRCSLLGLSMFTDETKAIDKYKQLKKSFKNLGKTIGTHLAKGKIEPLDGLGTPPDKQSHFDFFEKSGIDLSRKFEITQDLGGV